MTSSKSQKIDNSTYKFLLNRRELLQAVRQGRLAAYANGLIAPLDLEVGGSVMSRAELTKEITNLIRHVIKFGFRKSGGSQDGLYIRLMVKDGDANKYAITGPASSFYKTEEELRS